METDRKYINSLKGFLILCVVIGHFGQTIANNLPERYAFIGQGLVLFIYIFHMPLFLFVSGYLSQNAEKRRAKAVSDLLVPYLLFQFFVGIAMLVLTKSGEVLQNIFIPQMGGWYLLTLFSYRLVLPEIKKIRDILVVATVISICSCLMTGIGNEFALKKTLGYFVYFIMGNMIGFPKRMLSKKVSLFCLCLILIGIMFFASRFNCYGDMLSILTHAATSDDFKQWYYGPLVYLTKFFVTVLCSYLVICLIPETNSFFEFQGMDTMPLYLSHLVLFMAIGFCLSKDNWIVTFGISIIGIILSVVLFSSKLYRKTFNSFLELIKGYIFDVY